MKHCLVSAKEDEKGIAGQARNDSPFRMKKLFVITILFAMASGINAQSVALPTENFRKEICLNGLWDFKCNNESHWTQIRVPGLYSVLQESKWGKFLWDSFLYPKDWTREGAVYKKRLDLPADMTNKVAAFYCGAACFHTYVNFNGQTVGEFHDGFAPFEFSLNKALGKGTNDNILTVNISSDTEWTSSGESVDNRGILEDVFLKIYPDMYVDPLSTVIKTHVDRKQLEVGISVNNASNRTEEIVIRHFVTDKSGQVVKTFEGGQVNIPAGQSVRKNDVFPWTDPHLWTTYDPYLYHLHSVLYHPDGKPFDKNTQRFGFREISIRSHHLYLNGEELFLRGHGGHDLGDLQGTKEYMKKWLLQMKSKGINFMRMHVYPRHKVIYEAADEVGFLLEAEGAFHFIVESFGKDDNVWKMHLENLVKTHRNHPSVFVWSVSNELRWRGGGEKKPLIDYVKSLDDTRPVFASDFSLESRQGDITGHHYNGETVFEEWEEFGPDKPMIWDELGNVWQEERPLYNGTAGYEVSAQDWATGMWRDGYDEILHDIKGMVDGKIINGSLHRVNAYVPWDLSYIFMRWQPTNKARNIWLQYDSLSGTGLKSRVIQPCSSPLNIWDETLPEYEPNPGFYLFEKHIRTVRFFDTDDYQSYFGGTEAVKTGKLYYEHLQTADALHCNVELSDGKILSSNSQKLQVKAGDIVAKVNCRFSFPEVEQITDARLVRRFYKQGTAVCEEMMPVKIYPSMTKMLRTLTPADIMVVDNEKVSRYLKSNGLKTHSVKKGNLNNISQYRIVIANTVSDIPEAVLNTYLQEGGKVLFLNDHTRNNQYIVKKSMLTEDFLGTPVPDLSKNAFVSQSTGMKWLSGGGLVTARFNSVAEQFGMLTFKDFGDEAFIYTRFGQGNTAFAMPDMGKGQLSFRYNTDKKITNAHNVRLLLCDRLQQWYISDRKEAVRFQKNEEDITVNLNQFHWQSVKIEGGKLTLSGKSAPDLSEVYGIGLVVAPEGEKQQSFTITKLELRGKSFPSAVIPLNGGVHKAIADINQADLSFWRKGSGQEILDLPAGKTNYRTILAGNKDGEGAALYEVFCGKGIALHSGLNMVGQIDTEPVAACMMASLLRYLADYRPANPAKCGIIAEENIADLYRNTIGLSAENLPAENLPDLSDYHLLLIDGGSLNIASLLNKQTNKDRLRTFVAGGGKLAFTALNAQTVEVYRQLTEKDIRLTIPYLNERSHCVKAAISWTLRDTPKDPVEYYDKIMVPQPFERNYDPLISGMANKDLYWDGQSMFAQGIELAGMDPVVASPVYNILISNWKIDWSRPGYGGEYINEAKDMRRAYWFINRDPVLFKLTDGKGFYLFNQLIIEKENENAVRIARQLLTNLGCSIGSANCVPTDDDTFDRSAQRLQASRFEKVNRLLTPVTRTVYGSPESLKPYIVSTYKEAGSAKPKVLILGNTMMQRLAPVIKDRMGNNYEVEWNKDNLGTSEAMLAGMEPLLDEKANWSLILIAIGEDDIKSTGNGEKPSIPQYVANVEKIVKRLVKTSAKLYIVTLPPVPQNVKGYHNDLPTILNAAAKETVDKNDVYTYDLDSYILRKYPEYLQSGNVVFPEEMNRNIGKQLGEALISFGAQVLQ